MLPKVHLEEILVRLSSCRVLRAGIAWGVDRGGWYGSKLQIASSQDLYKSLLDIQTGSPHKFAGDFLTHSQINVQASSHLETSS